MCVTAFYFNPNPPEGGFKFVIAFNRDEYFNRPTRTAEFWSSHPDVVSSVDMTEGKEGGTWLGLSKRGRIAFLLNIFNPSGIREDAKGRGALVSDFLTGDATSEAYLEGIAKEGEQYNGFHLFTIDLRRGDAMYYSNESGSPPQRLQPGAYGVSNSALSKPWPKANHVKCSLEEILESCQGVSAEDLVKRLYDTLHRTTLLSGEEFVFQPGMTLEKMRAELPQWINIQTPVYGTRTCTVIVVDAADQVLYAEKSLVEPIDITNYQWSSKQHKFQLS